MERLKLKKEKEKKENSQSSKLVPKQGLILGREVYGESKTKSMRKQVKKLEFVSFALSADKNEVKPCLVQN